MERDLVGTELGSADGHPGIFPENGVAPAGQKYYVDGVSITGATLISPPVAPTELVTNGGFDGTTSWAGAVNVTADGVNQVNNPTTTANSHDVNLETEVDLEQGQDYTLTFTARGDAGRLFEAGIGDIGGSWGTDMESLSVTTAWQTYTLHLDSDTLGTGSHRVFFNFGHDTGLFEIDNVSLVAGHVGTEALNLPPTELVANGGFDGTTSWAGAVNVTADGVNQVNNPTTTANSHDVNLETEVDLEQGQGLYADLYGVVMLGDCFEAGIGDIGGSWGTDMESLSVTTVWQTYTLHLDSDTLGTGDHRVFFNFGHDTGLFEIDNVSLVAGHVGTEALNLPPTELVANGGFDGTTSWAGAVNVTADGVNQVNNPTTTANSYDVNLETEVDLEQGQDYTLTFTARGDAGRLFEAGIGDIGGKLGH